MSTWNDPELIALFSHNIPLIDVRAPIEFLEGSVPHSVNLPIMNDEERKAVGTCYKERGQNAAIELGHQLVSNEIKEERVRPWTDFIKANPQSELFCFRGGLRSQISCQWIEEKGIHKKPIHGGYKRLRTFFLSWLNDAPLPPILRIGGLTGSGKTKMLHNFRDQIDLENLANHRGSAFGPRGKQPSQVTFENALAHELMLKHERRIIVEDESSAIGKVVIPKKFFEILRSSPLIVLEIDHEKRLENIFNDYVKNSNLDFFVSNLLKLEKKLGNKKYQTLKAEIEMAFSLPSEMKNHANWISMLLKEYYDPLYKKDLRFNQDKVIFQGNEEEVKDYLSSIQT